MNSEIFEKVKKILCDEFNIDPQSINLDYKFFDGLGTGDIGFLSFLELIRHFEKAFNIRFTDKEVEKMGTVGEAVECIRQKLA